MLSVIRTNFPISESNSDIETNLTFEHEIAENKEIDDDNDDEILIYDDDDQSKASQSQSVEDTFGEEIQSITVDSSSSLTASSSDCVGNYLGVDSSSSSVDQICEQLSILKVKKNTVFQKEP